MEPRLTTALVFLAFSLGSWFLMLTAQRVGEAWRARKVKFRPLTADELATALTEALGRIETLERRVDHATNTTRPRQDSL